MDPRTAQYELTANALNTDKPSSFSSRQLLNLGLYELFEDNPKEALAKLHKSLAPTGDEERVFALAELSFLYAEKSGDRSYYLAATAYASAFLLPGKNGTPPKAIDPRTRWAVDIYNRALARGLTADDGEHVCAERRTVCSAVRGINGHLQRARFDLDGVSPQRLCFRRRAARSAGCAIATVSLASERRWWPRSNP